MAALIPPSASKRAACAASSVQLHAMDTIRLARSTSFRFVARISTIRFPYTFPIPTMDAVEIMFRIIFSAVPALSLVDPVRISGPASTSVSYTHLDVYKRQPVYCLDTMEYFPVEVQFRTMAMDFWASMEHRVCYKKQPENKDRLEAEFCRYAHILEEIENEFETHNERK